MKYNFFYGYVWNVVVAVLLLLKTDAEWLRSIILDSLVLRDNITKDDIEVVEKTSVYIGQSRRVGLR